MPNPDLPSKFLKPKHLTYWLRCLKTLLPNAYTSTDSNRLMLGYFTLSALDLLSALDAHTTASERQAYAAWIYHCQHPDGGFRGSPGCMIPAALAAPHNAHWDPATVPATYFALASLLVLGDGLERVQRRKCLAWLKRCQRGDGSFGEALGEGGGVTGGRDPRFGYTAMGIRWILGGEAEGEMEDVDTEKLVSSLRGLQTYDGGFSESAFRESHGGYTCCAIAALKFLQRLEDGVPDHALLLDFLVSRQTGFINPEDDPNDYASTEEPDVVGFNGRCNKVADTCYSWWNAASLENLGKLDLIDRRKASLYLLERTQHLIGGFGKYPDEPPDMYHSYFGLAVVSLLGGLDLKPIHPTACISVEACERLNSLPWKKGQGCIEEDTKSYSRIITKH